MSEHTAYRRAVLADPASRDPDVTAHYQACAQCRAFSDRLQHFESRLARALKIEVAERDNVLPFKGRSNARPARWYAVAASAAAGLLLAGTLWLSLPRTSLAADVVKHMAGEPDAWTTPGAVPAAAAETVLAGAKMHLSPSVGEVSYANSCSFRGRTVPHLVVRTGSGPVTVMVLVHESVNHDVRFDENGYRGVLVPIRGHGSIAVLKRDATSPDLDVEAVAARVRDAIVWSP